MKKWNEIVVWVVTCSCITILCLCAIYFYLNIEWFKNNAFDSDIYEINEGNYRTYIYHMHNSLITRSVGLISGFSMMMLGMSSIFYLSSKNTTGSGESAGVKISIATSSPGILAMIIGGVVLIITIQSKDDFPEFESEYYHDSNLKQNDSIPANEISMPDSIPSK